MRERAECGMGFYEEPGCDDHMYIIYLLGSPGRRTSPRARAGLPDRPFPAASTSNAPFAHAQTVTPRHTGCSVSRKTRCSCALPQTLFRKPTVDLSCLPASACRNGRPVGDRPRGALSLASAQFRLSAPCSFMKAS